MSKRQLMLEKLTSEGSKDPFHWYALALEYSGADHGVLRVDNVLEADAHYIFETDDGVLIQVHNRGYIYNTMPNSPGPPYFRVTPYFRAPKGPHDWLNRTVLVGGGERHSDPDHTIFRYYCVE